jgi:tetratricopeptide (TPR) repeat protein
MLGDMLVSWLAMRSDPQLLTKVRDDVEAFIRELGDITDKDPALALWAALLHSFRATIMMSGRSVTGATQDELAAEFGAVGARLEAIVKRWPQALRTAGNMLGMVQFAAGQLQSAKLTLEASLKQNPYNRITYNGLLGIATTEKNWTEMDRIVRLRLAAQPAAEDHVLLGKIAIQLGQEDKVLGHFREAIRQFPDDPLGYFAAAGWLIHQGANDAEATDLLTKGLPLAPRDAYAHALRSALHLLNTEAPQALGELQAALQADPTEELTNVLRDGYFTPAK